jgi:Do/DeqQ family serine protease
MNHEKTEIKNVNTDLGQKVLYTTNKEGEITPLDFTKTTQKVLDAVVHVSSISTPSMIYKREFEYRELPDPFRDFFENSPFEKYFDKRFENEQPGTNQEEKVNRKPIAGTGSGVIINENGYIITNNHVIENAEEVEITLHNNGTYKATVIGTDPTTDLALLQIKADDLKSISFVNSDDVEVGEWVLAVGNPFSLNSTVTAGIVSAKARNININKHKFAVESFIQTDAAINPGNSGGALVNLNGDLIGINTAIASRTGTYNGYGFAIPSNIVSKVVEDLLKYGAVQRGMLGVRIITLNGKLAKEKDVKLTQGVYVDSVNENSAADKAGIQEGDIIVQVDDVAIDTSPQLQEFIARKRPGDKVNVVISRNNSEKLIKVTLESTSGGTKIKSKEHRELFNRLGADFETLNKEKAAELDIKGGVQLVELYPGILRNTTQIKTGFIITKVDGKAVKNVEEFAKHLEQITGGVMLEGMYEDVPGTKYFAFGFNN